MTKLTRYTSIQAMKESKDFFQASKSNSERESELKEFLSMLKENPSLPPTSEVTKYLNKPSCGK
jgi:hypothetical protein